MIVENSNGQGLAEQRARELLAKELPEGLATDVRAGNIRYQWVADALRAIVAALSQQADPKAEARGVVDVGLSLADLCRLSGVFDDHSEPHLPRDRRIKEWLGKRIAEALAQQPAVVGTKPLSEFMAEQEVLHPGIRDKVQAEADELRASLAQQPAAARVDVRGLVALAEQMERDAAGCRRDGYIDAAVVKEDCAYRIRQTLGISAIAEAVVVDA